VLVTGAFTPEKKLLNRPVISGSGVGVPSSPEFKYSATTEKPMCLILVLEQKRKREITPTLDFSAC
jgi:hypothetical protein